MQSSGVEKDPVKHLLKNDMLWVNLFFLFFMFLVKNLKVTNLYLGDFLANNETNYFGFCKRLKVCFIKVCSLLVKNAQQIFKGISQQPKPPKLNFFKTINCQ